MEKGRVPSVKPYTKSPFLKSRSTESEHGFSNERKTTFRNAARQVWIANSFSKHQVGVEPHLKSNEDSQQTASNKISEAFASSPSRPQSVKRKGTPEIFPMSSEMRKTLVLLGNLDFVPEDERQKQEALEKPVKQKKTSSFRQRTQLRIIQPQRFIRSVRMSTVKNVSEKSLDGKGKTRESESIRTTADSLINSRASNNTGALCAGKEFEKEENNNETRMKLENLSAEDEVDGNEQKTIKKNVEKEPSTLDLPVRNPRGNNRNSWRRSIKKYQHGEITPNPSNPFYLRKRFSAPKRGKVHLSRSWQSSTNIPERLPIMRRAVSLSSPRSFTSDVSELSELRTDYTNNALKDGKSIDELTSDIQERCSKWFEFRQKIMKSYEYR
jgi:hypothetical protein